ncbi:filamentous haemagglutinin family protein [Comamonas sp. GB3 AK4-5]|uniref:filamentous haemagglutinin family protein n=1 Tax=Comamonas sp. GB3 AK4-5 TaxID=3231487 RepID=UPI00351DFABB
MNTRASSKDQATQRTRYRVFRRAPIAQAIALTLVAGGTMVQASAQTAFSPGWFSAKGAVQNTAAQTGMLPNGLPAMSSSSPAAQQNKANEQLVRSITNLNLAARGIAAQQAAQAAARAAALAAGGGVPDGLGEGGLKIDSNSLTAGWINANAPKQTTADGKTHVAVEQTADKAILNWESFNVGKNTTLEFLQQKDWAVLNRVNDPNARPSQIQGQIKGDGTVLIVNQNGIIFSGSSQINTRNLAAAAVGMSDAQFKKGLFSDAQGTAYIPTFANDLSSNASSFSHGAATADVVVEAGARLQTHKPASVTEGGGYVLLVGRETHNAGEITTASGQTVLAAGDAFVIQRGQGSDANQNSSTRGNVVGSLRNPGSAAGLVRNSGLIQASTGDITLTGHDVRQQGVAVASTSVHTRGTVHLSNAAGDAGGHIALEEGSVTSVLLEESATTALDAQRETLIKESDKAGDGVQHRRDQSLVLIDSAGAVDFRTDSLTVATGGQVLVKAAQADVASGAVIDVSGAVGVRVDMESNNVLINVQGNEQRDASVNRDAKGLNNKNIWVDRRDLVFVPAGTNGYETDRWYTAGGLLEVGGYLGITGHGIGEWMAQGGTVQFAGGQVHTHQGSLINLAGGSLDVQTGYVNQTYLKGADGRIYNASSAPGDLRYTGLYQGFESTHARWGVTETYAAPLIAAGRRLENGYTVGRDAGRLVIATQGAQLEGAVDGSTFQGERQTRGRDAALDGYRQAQTAVAQRGQLIIGALTPVYDANTKGLRESPAAVMSDVTLGGQPGAGTHLDAAWINAQNLGALQVYAKDRIAVDEALQVTPGGQIALHASDVAVEANLTARGGSIQLGDMVTQHTGSGSGWQEQSIGGVAASGHTRQVTVGKHVTLDARGLWSNQVLDADNSSLPFVNGGRVVLRSSGDVKLGDASLIDVSSGAALNAKGSLSGGKGGDVTLATGIPAQGVGGATQLVLEGELRGHGVKGGGTMMLQTGEAVVIGGQVGGSGGLLLDTGLFKQGFSHYEVNAVGGLTVAEGAKLEVSMPVLRIDSAKAQGMQTGADPSKVLEVWEAPLFVQDPARKQMKQRAGASLALNAGSVVQTASLLIDKGAELKVDPGQSIRLAGNAQITIEGELRAHGGRIAVLGGDFGSGTDLNRPAGVPNARSLWIGEHAVLDVSGQAHTALDGNGHSYGVVQSGGSIELGAKYSLESRNVDAIDAFLVVKKGAVLNASGASGLIHVPGQGDISLAGNGGTIALSAANGLFIDGQLSAHAGGAGAKGGTLAINLETPVYLGVERFSKKGAAVDDAVRVPRELVIEQVFGGSGLDDSVQAGQKHDSLVYGKARFGVDAIQAGGFDTAALYANGLLSFDGSIDLHMKQALYLTASSIGLSTQAARDSQVRLSAAYLRLSGSERREVDGSIMPNPVFGSGNVNAGGGQLGVPLLAKNAHLQLEGSMVDIVGEVGFGTRSHIILNGPTNLAVERDAFGTVRIASQGDLRLRSASLYSPGDTTLAAAQIYGGGNVTVGLVSKLNEWGNVLRSYDQERRLDIERIGTSLPAMPYSVFGNMGFTAATINQGGVLRAPLGSITLGDAGSNGYTGVVNLLPGSITSVSAKGLAMPYGGTVDGLTYNYNGKDAVYVGIGGEPSIEFKTHALNAQDGAVIDLSGGGELTGAAFLQGRGGSTDARINPLVQMAEGRFVLPGLATNPVYAIVPGAQAGYAPVASEKGAGDPAIGRQITIGEGVPGLPAGTYTLMPSTYALLPGAFRVELNGLASSHIAFGSTTAMRNGSWSTSAQLGIANTGYSDALPTQVILTAADTLRTYSQYNETSYAEFALQQAAREGAPAPLLERDGKALNLMLISSTAAGSFQLPQLRFAAQVQGTPADQGKGTVLRVLGGTNFEILAQDAAPTAGFTGISVHADMLNQVGASRMEIGGRLSSTYIDSQTGSLQHANTIAIGGAETHNIIVRSGAQLEAADVFLMSGRTDGGITLEQGASINTLGKGRTGYGAEQGYIYQPGPVSVLAVSNNQLDLLAPAAPNPNDPRVGAGAIELGVCAVGAHCSGDTRLYSEGTIATATDNRFVLGDAVRYGTRNLSLALGGVNIGSAQALESAAARGALPAGMVLNQQVLDRLLLGDTSTGAPALEALSLTARESVNFFGDVTLSTYGADGKSALQRLVLGTPAIYGYGDAGDVARIHTDTLIWTGSRTPAGSIVAGGPGTGQGQLVVDAREIVFGYGPKTQPDTVRDHDRLALGFASMHLNASERVTATHKGSLAFYATQGAWDPVAKAYTRSGGDLFISTPLLTGTAGSINKITAGGDIHVSGSGAAAPDNATLAAALGAELALDSKGGQLVLDTAVLLPSGKLSLSAQGDVTLNAGAQLELAGRKIDFFDVSKYSWGGDVALQSRAGDVVQADASHINLSAEHNRAGKLTVAATQGHIALTGQMDGHSSGHYDAGGTLVPYLAGRIELHGQSIDDFAGLNHRLTEGGVFGGRSFRLGQGDLNLGNELKAHEINVSLDQGQLTVNGRIDASGEQAGSIRLSAKNGVTLGNAAVLDASASVLRVDSYGKPIEAPNRAVIEIDSGTGLLAIASGARMDLRVAGSAQNFGTVALNAARVGSNDVAIDAAGTVAIAGAKSIHVNAFITDNTAAAGTETTTDGKSYQVIDQDYLNRLNDDSRTFINAALANGTLMNGKLAGLRAYQDQFHLRPGVEVVANLAVNPDGNLHVDGDIDLSGHRYASVNPHTQRTLVHGSGEAGALVLRAQGDLDVFGSISDGFDGSRLKPSFDSVGWLLTKGQQPWASDVVVPRDGMVTLDAGTVFNSGKVLNYELPINAMQMAAGTLLPAKAALAQPLSLARGTVLSAAVHDANGQLLYAAGSVLADAVTLPAQTQLDAGFRLPGAARMAAMTWPAGVALPAPPSGNAVVLSSAIDLKKGAFIPSETDVKLPGGVDSVDLRPRDAQGNQGRIWALAPMLAAGSQSFDISLVAGADTAAADRLASLPGGAGHLRLSDMHYGMGGERSAVPGTGSPAVFRYSNSFPAALLADLEMYASWGYEVPTIVPGALVGARDIELLLEIGLIWDSMSNLNEYGHGEAVSVVTPATPPDYVFMVKPAREQLPSVVRTGTGDLRLVSAKNIATSSLFGVYTAGTPSAALAAAGASDPYNQPRSVFNGSVLGEFGGSFEGLVNGGSESLYQAWYPEAGGNLLLRAGGNISGDSIGRTSGALRSDALGYRTERITGTASVGNWLWRQGSGSVAGVDDVALPTAWWINFGTYVPSREESPYNVFATMPRFTGFTGFGTLGGGNLLLEAGGNAGMLQARGDHGAYYINRSSGLNLAVASTGRVGSDGKLVQTGGGDLDIRIGGGFNSDATLNAFTGGNSAPQANSFAVGGTHRLDLNGSFTNLRGALRMQAGAVGSIAQSFGGGDPKESRPYDAFTASNASTAGGPVLVLGDAGVRIESRGDLVLGNVTDAGRVPQYHGGTPFSANGKSYAGNGWSWFSLWTPATAVDLLAAGGNLTPTMAMHDRHKRTDSLITDLNFMYPSVLRAASASGNVYYGKFVKSITAGENNDPFQPAVTLAPSPVAEQFVAHGTGQLELLARGSIYAQGAGFSVSGADPTALPNPFTPGFVGRGDPAWFGLEVIHNVSPNTMAAGPMLSGALKGDVEQRYPLFAFTPPTASGHVYVGQEPARYYAVEGDLVGLRTGSIIYRGRKSSGKPGSLPTWYDGGGALAMRAGRDIVNSGTTLGAYDPVDSAYGTPGGALDWYNIAYFADPSAPPKIDTQGFGSMVGNLIVHTSADDVSVVQAGRDIRFSSFKIAGPGLLDISAGRNVYMADKAELRSLGAVVNVKPGDRSSGAAISVAAGLGQHGADWTAFADRYLDPANLANLSLPLADQPGKAVRIYDGSITLAQWLKHEFGYTGDEAGASAFLAAKQVELDGVRNGALAAGSTAANRDLAREYKLESQLHLVNWLTERFGGANGRGLHFDAASMDARSFFAALPPEQRSAFLRNVYYAELKASGREYNDVDGKRYGSYLRGREAIETLLPSKDAQGKAIAYEGDLTMFSSARYFKQFVDVVGTWRPQPGVKYLSEAEWIAAGSPGYDTPYYKINDAGIHTDFGGNINLLVPGGRTLIGVDGGYPPGAGSGVLTQGEGDINIFSKSDILMGQSRVFTTFGGNILGWSAEGDINAGRGAKTTVVATPQRRVYDNIGNVMLSPSTPNTGAGIATLNPIAEVPPGDIDLIAPLGTIDAGEAGIRVSGNVNLAALQVVNAENIQVQGKAVGIPMVAAVNVGALSNASAAASQATAAAQDVLQRERAAARQAMPSVFTVRVLGFGNESMEGGGKLPQPSAATSKPAGVAAYDPQSALQLVAVGKDVDPLQAARLNPEQRRQLQQ